jgi:hypothetical protein
MGLFKGMKDTLRTHGHWGEELTEVDKRKHTLSENGYHGPTNKDGYPVNRDGQVIDPTTGEPT